MQVHDGNNEDNLAILQRVNDPIGKASEAAAANVFLQRLPSFWIGDDPLNGVIYFVQKLKP